MPELAIRDTVVIASVIAIAAAALFRPFVGLLGYVVFSIVNPHTMTWSLATDFHPMQPIAGATILGYLLSSEPKRLPRHPATYLLLILWALFAVSSHTAVHPEWAFEYLNRVSKIFIMMLLTIALLHTQRRVLQFARVMALSLGFFALKAGTFAILSGGHYMVWGPVYTFLWANNAIGAALAMNIPVLFHLRRIEQRRWLRHVMTAMLLLSYPAILCTFSRGAWLAAAAATAFLLWRSHYRALLVVAILVASLMIPPLLSDRVVNRYGDLVNYDEEKSAQNRLWTWEFCIRVGLANPLTGAGFAFPSEYTYNQYYPEFLVFNNGTVASCHSAWFTVLGEHGIPAFALWSLLIALLFTSLHRMRRATKGSADGRWICESTAMLQGAFVTWAVGGIFLDLSYFDVFYWLAALTIVLKPLVAGVSSTPPRLRPEMAERAAARSGLTASRSRPAIAILALTLLLAPVPALAQSYNPLHAASANRGFIRTQMLVSLGNLQQAAEMAAVATGPSELRAAQELVTEAYVLVRAASQGIQTLWNKTRTRHYSDPMLALTLETMWRLQLLNLGAQNDLTHALVADGDLSNYVTGAVEKLRAAVREAETALAVF